MPTFRAEVETRHVFAKVKRPDGRTLEVDPGELVILDSDPDHRALVLVEDKTDKSDDEQAEAAETEASQGETTEAEPEKAAPKPRTRTKPRSTP